MLVVNLVKAYKVSGGLHGVGASVLTPLVRGWKLLVKGWQNIILGFQWWSCKFQ